MYEFLPFVPLEEGEDEELHKGVLNVLEDNDWVLYLSPHAPHNLRSVLFFLHCYPAGRA